MEEDVDARIQISLRRLREWQWLHSLSTDPQTVLINLKMEARELIELGRGNPHRALVIGKIVVAYHHLIMAVKEAADRNVDAA